MRNRKVLSLEWKNDGVMDDKSGDDDTGEVRRLYVKMLIPIKVTACDQKFHSITHFLVCCQVTLTNSSV